MHFSPNTRAVFALLLFLAGPAGLQAAEPIKPTFPVPAGLRAELFAGEPMFANPVAISVDADGSVYVTETRRRKANALDIRQNADWLLFDLSFTNVAMKEAFYRDQFRPENSERQKHRVQDLNGDGLHDWRDLTVLSEVIYKLTDTDGDGRADRSTIFAEDFNTIVTDVAAGVLARGKDVYATVAPDFWKLTDNDGDGRADERVSLAHGFAVHIAYAGHNMHGPTMGPDGRIYWSIADIGSNHLPNEGAIFRIDPDGQNFEVFARGLRNPHEFVFNEYGDLFTADNDSDNGDRERWLHIVEGADYGWRNSWQYQIGAKWGAKPDTYALWNAEGLWHLWFPEQAAWLLPPAAHVGPGPCGMKYYPGGELDDHFGGKILLAEFTGSPGSSSVNAFTLKQSGATYDVVTDEPFLTQLVPTGLDFAPDGSSLFIADWAGGWDLNDQGRVWRLFKPGGPSTGTVNSRALLNGGIAKSSPAALIALLGDHNLNVRREAQFALVEMGTASVAALTRTARSNGPQLARIHALWGLEMIQRKSPGALDGVIDLLGDNDPEIRAQTARMMGDGRVQSASAALINLLNDPSARVRFMAAMALGKLGVRNAIQPIEAMLSRNGKLDKHLRYAGIRALELIGDVSHLANAGDAESPDVRLARVVALRRLERPEVANYLNDADPLVVVEAARAINDVPINAAMPQLAELVDRPLTNEALARRVLNARFRAGTAADAEALAAFAADSNQLDSMRREAVRLLADWKEPNVRDHVVGALRPVANPTRDTAPVAAAMNRHLIAMLNGDDELSAAATRLAGDLGLKLDGGTLLAWAADPNKSDDARVTAMELLAANNSPQLNDALAATLNASSTPPAVYAAGLRILAASQPEVAARELEFLSRYRLNKHIQAALAAFDGIQSTNLTASLGQWLDQLAAGTLPRDIELDVFEAALQRPSLKPRLQTVTDKWNDADTMRFAMVEQGGDAARGRRVFFEKAETECLRCHKVTVDGEVIGGDAAPNLTGLGKRANRRYIVSSIIDPNRDAAAGYEQAVITLKNGTILSGRVLAETDDTVTLEIPLAGDEDFLEAASAGATVEKKVVSKAEISKREKGLSGMPEGFGAVLTPFELRDLVEFLATQ